MITNLKAVNVNQSDIDNTDKGRGSARVVGSQALGKECHKGPFSAFALPGARIRMI